MTYLICFSPSACPRPRCPGVGEAPFADGSKVQAGSGLTGAQVSQRCST